MQGIGSNIECTKISTLHRISTLSLCYNVSGIIVYCREMVRRTDHFSTKTHTGPLKAVNVLAIRQIKQGTETARFRIGFTLHSCQRLI